MKDSYLRELNLYDARTLSDWLGEATPPAARSAVKNRVTYNGMKQFIRRLLAMPQMTAYVWEDSENSDSEEAKKLAILFFEQSILHPGIIQIELVLNPNLSIDEVAADYLLNLLLQKTGSDEEVKAIALQIPEKYEGLIRASQKYPFNSEEERYPMGRSEDGYAEEWLRIFSLSKTSNWPFTWVFVPTEVGVIAVYGDEDEIRFVKWLDYESFIEDIRVRELCIADGFADEYGKMKAKEMALAIEPSDRLIPQALQEAVKQIKEYLAGQRRSFDLPLIISDGTSFQRQVWRAISEIPYGSTATYEEIGTMVAGGDSKVGRGLSRSVGVACGANPLVIFTPCHRVIAKDGKLQGYAYGVFRKDFLLAKEMLGMTAHDEV